MADAESAAEQEYSKALNPVMDGKLMSFVRKEYRKRLRDEDDMYQLSIEEETTSNVYICWGSTRIFGSDYVHLNDEHEFNSPDCDTDGNSLSIFSFELANNNEAEVRVQMIENYNGIQLFGQSLEKCHVKDKAICTNAEKRDPNNLLFM
eukprot:gene62012-84804_t